MFRFNLFQNLQAYQSRQVDLNELVRLIRHDNYVRSTTELYRNQCRTISRSHANRETKAGMMPAFAVAVGLNGMGRKLSHVTHFTGLSLCDIDHVGDVEEVFRRVIDDPHTLLAYRTISGEGLRIIFPYRRTESEAPLNAVPYPAAYALGNRHYAQLTGCECDSQCGDPTRLSGLAHDPQVYVNPDATPFVVSDEEILNENLSPGREPGKPRHEYPRGTHQAEPEAAWPLVEQMLSRRDMQYQSGHHHDYVLHASCLFNRFGTPQEELQAWAESQWADYDVQERTRCIQWAYQKHAAEHGTWRLNKRGRRGEVSMITLPEIREWLNGQHIEIAYNLVTDQTMFRIIDHSPLNIEHLAAQENATGNNVQCSTLNVQCSMVNGQWPTLNGQCSTLNGQWSQLDERALCSLRSQIATDTGKRVLKNDVMDIIRSDFARLIHPVRDFITSLPPWDGTDRVTQLANFLTAEPVQPGQTQEEAQEELRWALHKWLAATVATWMDDNVCNHTILTLIGRQGIYKTTFFRHLLPPTLRMYFWENARNSFTSKDEHLALTENCLVEIEEIDMSSPRETAELKALATALHVKERRPYSRFMEEKPRLASFCATGNERQFLTDDTGNRRWLCFLISHITDPRQWSLDHEQLYAQLRDEIAQGFAYWFRSSDEQRIAQQNRHFRIESDEEQLIRTRLRVPLPGEPYKLMNSATICQMLNGGNITRGLSSKKFGSVMRKLGFEHVHTKAGEFYKTVEIPFTQTQEYLSIIEGSQTTKSTDIQSTLPF